MNEISNVYHNLVIALADLAHTAFRLISLNENTTYNDKQYIKAMATKVFSLTLDIKVYTRNNLTLTTAQLAVLSLLTDSITSTTNTLLHPIS